MLSLSTPERSWSPPTVTSPCSTQRRAPRLEPGANFSIPGFLLSGCARYNQLWGKVDFCKGSIQRVVKVHFYHSWNFECFTKSDNDDLFSLQADEGVGLGRMDRVGRVTLFHLYWQTLQYRWSIHIWIYSITSKHRNPDVEPAQGISVLPLAVCAVDIATVSVKDRCQDNHHHRHHIPCAVSLLQTCVLGKVLWR